MQEDVIVMGAVPPPVGGVRVCVFRLAYWLSSLTGRKEFVDLGQTDSESYVKELISKGWSVQRFRTFYLPIFVCMRILKSYFSGRSTVLNVHSKRNIVAIVAVLFKVLGKRFYLVATVHSFREDVTFQFKVANVLFVLLVRKADLVLVTNEDIAKRLLELGMNAKKICVSSTYLEPTESEKSQIIPKLLANFISSHSVVFSGNASYLSYYEGEDLYGLDMLINVLARLKTKENVGLVFALSPTIDKIYVDTKLKEIEKLKMQNDIFLYQSNDSFIPILENSDVFLRPTNTDGDSISVREALQLNVKVIASDCVERPQGVYLHKTRDESDLLRQVEDVLREGFDKDSIVTRPDNSNSYIKNMFSLSLEST